MATGERQVMDRGRTFAREKDQATAEGIPMTLTSYGWMELLKEATQELRWANENLAKLLVHVDFKSHERFENIIRVHRQREPE